MTTTMTTIHLVFQGIPMDVTVADLGNLAEIKRGLIEAKKLGFEGQPLFRSSGGGFGGKGGKPAPVAPVRNEKGQLCCPHHSGDKRAVLQRKDWSSGVVHACGCKDESGAWCRYKLDAAQYEDFERSVPKADPVAATQAPAPAKKPLTVEGVRNRYYERFRVLLGGATWDDVRRYWNDQTLVEPTTTDGWLAEAQEMIREEQRIAKQNQDAA